MVEFLYFFIWLWGTDGIMMKQVKISTEGRKKSMDFFKHSLKVCSSSTFPSGAHWMGTSSPSLNGHSGLTAHMFPWEEVLEFPVGLVHREPFMLLVYTDTFSQCKILQAVPWWDLGSCTLNREDHVWLIKLRCASCHGDKLFFVGFGGFHVKGKVISQRAES